MFTDSNELRDEVIVSLGRGAAVESKLELRGFVLVELFDEHGNLKYRERTHNLITDAGDLYYATKAVVAIAPASGTAPTAITGMKLGTGSTAVSKASTGAALVTYLTASNAAFDATYPQVTNLGTTLGVTAVYKTTWAAGVATSASIAEVVIVNDSGTNATSSAANTISRALITVNKGALDTLAVTWSHKFLGA